MIIIVGVAHWWVASLCYYYYAWSYIIIMIIIWKGLREIVCTSGALSHRLTLLLRSYI